MGLKNHSEVDSGSIHHDINIQYANQGERLADDSLVEANLYQIAMQLDDFSTYRLVGVDPIVWKETTPTVLEGDTIYNIFTMNDFPTAVGGVRTLVSGKYVIKNSLTTSDRFAIGAGSSVTFAMENQRFNVFTYTGTGTLFTSLNAAFFVLEKNNFLLSGVGAQLLDVIGGNFIIRSEQAIFTGSGASIGTIVDAAVLIDDMFANGFADGIVIENTPFGLVTEVIMHGVSGGTGTYVSILGKNTGAFALETSNNALNIGVNESFFYIEPVVVGVINISNSFLLGAGSYFRLGNTGPIAGFTDSSTPPTAVTVADSGGNAQFNSVGHGLNVGESVEHTIFAESSYNGFFVVTSVTANTYFVGLSFVSLDAGLFETTTCQVNDVGHGLSNGDTLSIFGTINFGGGYKIFNVQANSFEITLGKVFPGSETTGNWDMGSLNEQSSYVNTFRNGPQKDSSNIGSAVVGGNMQPTPTTTKDLFVDLNLNASMVEAGNIELWTLTDTTTGEMRYDGLFPASMTYGGLAAASSSGGSQRFDYRLLQNGSPLPVPDNVDIPVDVNGNVRSTALSWPISVQPGDLFRIQAANRDGTSALVVDTLKIDIKG